MQDFIPIPTFTTGERSSQFSQIKDIAARRNLTAVIEHADRGLAHERETHALDNQWSARTSKRMYIEEATEVDNLVDPVLVSIRDIAVAQTRGLPVTHPLHRQVDGMLKDIYPQGVGTLVTLPYVDQVNATEAVLHKLQTTYAPLVITLGLSARVTYLAELAPKYRAAVDSGRTLRFPEVQAMHDQGHLILRELIARILGMFCDSRDPDQVAAREELLEPVHQVTAVLRMRRARRRSEGAADEDAIGDGEDVIEDDDDGIEDADMIGHDGTGDEADHVDTLGR